MPIPDQSSRTLLVPFPMLAERVWSLVLIILKVPSLWTNLRSGSRLKEWRQEMRRGKLSLVTIGSTRRWSVTRSWRTIWTRSKPTSYLRRAGSSLWTEVIVERVRMKLWCAITSSHQRVFPTLISSLTKLSSRSSIRDWRTLRFRKSHSLRSLLRKHFSTHWAWDRLTQMVRRRSIKTFW